MLLQGDSYPSLSAAVGATWFPHQVVVVKFHACCCTRTATRGLWREAPGCACAHFQDAASVLIRCTGVRVHTLS